MARIVYFGSPGLAVGPLIALVEAGHDVRLVVTRPDRRRARRGGLAPTPVKEAAIELGLATTSRPEDALEAGADLGVVVAYGRLLKPPLLGGLPLVNVHLSLLPRWRGAAPVEWAILAGDRESGASLLEIVAELDAGGVYAQEAVPIGEEETAESLSARLIAVGTRLLLERLDDPPASLGTPQPQVGEVVWAPPLRAEDRRLRWGEPAEVLSRVVRVGGAWTTLDGRRLLVRSARPAEDRAGTDCRRLSRPIGFYDGESVVTGRGRLLLEVVQLEGRRAVAGAEFFRGLRRPDGVVLGT